MKKFFFCAAAAIVALASCSKTQVVYNDAPQEISFKAVTGAITKAEQSGTLSGNMGVFAFVNDGKNPYFANAEFTGTTTWTGNQYWPISSNLDFVVYAPYGTASYAANKLTVVGANNSSTVNTSQIDYLYGAEYYDNTNDKGYLKETVSTTLKHALSKLTFAFSGSNVKLVSISLVQPTLKGYYVVDYSNPIEPSVNWTNTTPEAAPSTTLTGLSEVVLPATADNTSTTSVMVVPAEASDLIIEYIIGDTDDVLSTTVDLTGNWVCGTHYTYNIKITPQQIEFDAPTNAGWDTPNPAPGNINVN